MEMASKLAIDGVVELYMWVAYFASVAEKHYAAKEVYKAMMYLGGLLATQEHRIVSLQASGYPKLDRFTRTGGRLWLTRLYDGYRFCFKFSHDEKKIQLVNLRKEVLYEFDNATPRGSMDAVINDLLDGRLN